MSYIGRTPVVGNFVKLDAITTSATATYNLLNGGVAYFPQTANNCIVSLNGVIQSPTSAYTISGSTIVFSDALTSSDTIDFILVLGDVLSIGTPSDGTITSAKLASGTDGLFAWQSVQTTGFTAVAARAYPCNTTSSAFTVTLPASPSVGDQVQLVDYAGTFDTNFLTINPNGEDIEGGTDNLALRGDREGVILTYIDSTQGWIATSGINEGTDALSVVPYSVDFLVVAGGAGGGGGGDNGGGGGAGGYRNSFSTETSGGNSSSEASLFFSLGTTYTITVGAGGAGGNGLSVTGGSGVNSSISGSGITTITSSGGGGGGGYSVGGANGGSGGGDGSDNPASGGSGTANQGFNGGTSTGASSSGGGGASAVGSNGSASVGGNGGNGLASSITGSSVTRAGGGGGGGFNGTGGTGGTGGGGNGGDNHSDPPTAGTTNTGGGGGGAGDTPAQSAPNGASGGSGVVILRMPTANYSGTTTGSPTVTTDGSNTILVYNASGTYTG